jgi:hypothetical protein
MAFWDKWFAKPVWNIVRDVKDLDEVPTILPDKGAVLVGTDAQPKLLVFDCPCGAGHRFKVMLDQSVTPHWKVLQRTKLSVYPSLKADAPQDCHFLITNGNIMWIGTDRRV